MAEQNTASETPTGGSRERSPEDYAIGGESTAGMELQFAVKEWFSRFGFHILAIVLVGVVVIGVYGVWSSRQVSASRGSAAQIATVMDKLPAPLLQLSQPIPGQPAAADAATLTARAQELAAIGDTASGAAAADAWLKAAELYRLAGATDARREVLTKAAANPKLGVLTYAANAALANMDIEAGDFDAGLARFRTMTSSPDAFTARRATLDLAEGQEAAGDLPAAIDTLGGFLTRFPNAPEVADATASKARLEAGKIAPATPAEASPEPAEDADLGEPTQEAVGEGE